MINVIFYPCTTPIFQDAKKFSTWNDTRARLCDGNQSIQYSMLDEEFHSHSYQEDEVVVMIGARTGDIHVVSPKITESFYWQYNDSGFAKAKSDVEKYLQKIAQ